MDLIGEIMESLVFFSDEGLIEVFDFRATGIVHQSKRFIPESIYFDNISSFTESFRCSLVCEIESGHCINHNCQRRL